MSSRAALRALRTPVVIYRLSHKWIDLTSSSSVGRLPLEDQYPPGQASSCRPYLSVHFPSSSSSFHFRDSRLFSANSAASFRVVLVNDDAHYTEIMKGIKSKDTLGVVYFTAQWCGPCKQIAPYIDELSQQFDDVIFLKVDVDKVEVEETMKNSHIGVVPTFHFHKGGKLIGELTGAVKDKLKHLVETLRSKP